MHSEEFPVPGARDVRATLDSPDDETDAVVVACPPHPQHRGHRGDKRLKAVSEYLTSRGSAEQSSAGDRTRSGNVACLRFDYGDWDEGYGELEDARNALRWADGRYDRIGIFGFSFGGGIAALAAATTEVGLAAVALLAPASKLGDVSEPRSGSGASRDAKRPGDDLDAAAALPDIAAPVLVVYGVRDTTAEWKPLVERARELDAEVAELSADHFFVGQHDTVADVVGAFLVDHL